ncbi:MAG: glycosyltransferase [Fimbriimonadaceae bacterium]|nr:glycosyltransferase [Alphaproteobacteria bacterium]
MSDSSKISAHAPRSMRILQCLRAPVGGLFRHVCDLVRAQSTAGHQVGLVCDSTTGGDSATEILKELAKDCALGIHRIVMPRQIGVNDWMAVRHVARFARKWNADILHGHGAKGGAYVRLANTGGHPSPLRFYTPHGGSLHYSPYSLPGMIFLNLERILLSRTDGIIFESEYARTTYGKKIGGRTCPQRIIYNGVGEGDFRPIKPMEHRADLLFVGELRVLKGVATLLEALHELKKRDITPSVLIVGSGSDEGLFKDLMRKFDLEKQVSFPGAMPAREAFARGGTLVVPSHKESFPYIVLEAAAANMPMIATGVGGIPEIFGPYSSALVNPQDCDALAASISEHLENRQAAMANAHLLQKRVRETFSVEKMAHNVLLFYAECGDQAPLTDPFLDPSLKNQKEKMPVLSG